MLQRVATSHNVANNFEHDKRRISLLLKANKSKSSCTFQLIGATQRGQLQKAWPGLAESQAPRLLCDCHQQRLYHCCCCYCCCCSSRGPAVLTCNKFQDDAAITAQTRRRRPSQHCSYHIDKIALSVVVVVVVVADVAVATAVAVELRVGQLISGI